MKILNYLVIIFICINTSVKADSNKTLINALSRFGETKILKKACEITFKPTNVTIEKILKVIKNNGLTILDLQTKDANLEDVFMSLTKN